MYRPTPTIQTGLPTVSAAPSVTFVIDPSIPPVVDTTSAPVTSAPVVSSTAAPVLPQPTAAPVTSAPFTSGPTATPVTTAPSSSPSIGPTPAPTFAPTSTDGVQLFSSPAEKWSVTLEAGTGLYTGKVGEGNAVTISPDGMLLYITRDNGRLDVLKPSDGTVRWSYQPVPVGPRFNPVHCTSGVYFGNMNGIGDFVVYTIIDEPSPSSEAFEDATRSVNVCQQYTIRR